MADPTTSAADGEMARVLGRMEAKVAAIEGRIERIEISSALRMSVIEQKLDNVGQTLAQSLGAMKLMHWLGGAAFATVGFVTSVLLRR
ncbi:hypothetical protein [Limobrevibacterium gyesilva]|uniref:Uncharacterized protein n=1 Tax=Limobrevibacterium gyesilva TaxID=2991712 RepID=A0AA41YMC9_9PROT|nr:hypothetical protein [Limobrevibacterium gyesilva]MCW3476556.1 hypothetical protein [Limobrevibacterium gyesilva]